MTVTQIRQTERPPRCKDCGIPLLAMYVSESDRSRCGSCVRLERQAEIAREAVEAVAFGRGTDPDGPEAA